MTLRADEAIGAQQSKICHNRPSRPEAKKML
jgi:hypothetical protein